MNKDIKAFTPFLFRTCILLLTCILTFSGKTQECDKVQIQKIQFQSDVSLQSLTEVRNTNEDQWEEVKANHPNFGFTTSSIWFRSSIVNNCIHDTTLIVEVSNPILDSIYFYTIDSNTVSYSIITGDRFSFQERAMDHRKFRFPVHLKGMSSKKIYFKVNNGGEQFHFDFKVSSAEYFAKFDRNENLFFGVYYGIILFVFFFNLFLYFTIRERSTLYYISYILFLLFLQLSLNGHGFELLYPESTFIANHANPLFASLSVLALLLFTRDFLKLSHYTPKLNKTFGVLAILIAVNVVLALVPNMKIYQVSVWSINGLTLILNLFILPTAYIVLRKGFKPARFFLLAFTILILSVFGFVLRNFGTLPSNFLTDYGLQIGSTFEVILITFAIIDRFRQFKEDALRRAEELGEFQRKANIELEKKVDERTSELREQKDIVERKNTEIVDSIQYAKRLQEAILPSDKRMKDFFQNHFLLYIPKDIVAGDFYWAEEMDEWKFFAAADCTGHGVPGAMVSVVCHNALNRSVKEFNLTNPAEILDNVRRLVIETFAKSESEVKDGMDIGLCAYNVKSNQLYFAGAHNGLYVITRASNEKTISYADKTGSVTYSNDRKHALCEIKPDKQPVGKFAHMTPFTVHQVPFQENDILYLYSDGYADQFGGPRNKKFKSKNFKKLLLECHQLQLEEQKQKIQYKFQKWKGHREQLDDVCVLGIRL